MHKPAPLIIGLSLLVTPLSQGRPPQAGAVKFRDYSGQETLCETEMAHLDDYAIQIQNDPKRTAYVIVYGGRYGTARHEMKQRRARIRRYLAKTRKIESGRVRVVDGGFREKVTVELWLVSIGDKLPQPRPTVSPNNVKYRKTRSQFSCSKFY